MILDKRNNCSYIQNKHVKTSDDRTDLVLHDDVGLNPETDEDVGPMYQVCSVVPFTVFLQFL